MAAGAAPAQVIGDPRRIEPGDQRGERVEILEIERIGGADGQRHAVEHHGGQRAGALERRQRPSPAIMKFSEIASNQSTRAVPSQSRGKCGGRSPTPWPRYGTAIAMGAYFFGVPPF